MVSEIQSMVGSRGQAEQSGQKDGMESSCSLHSAQEAEQGTMPEQKGKKSCVGLKVMRPDLLDTPRCVPCYLPDTSQTSQGESWA